MSQNTRKYLIFEVFLSIVGRQKCLQIEHFEQKMRDFGAFWAEFGAFGAKKRTFREKYGQFQLIFMDVVSWISSSICQKSGNLEPKTQEMGCIFSIYSPKQPENTGFLSISSKNRYIFVEYTSWNYAWKSEIYLWFGNNFMEYAVFYKGFTL